MSRLDAVVRVRRLTERRATAEHARAVREAGAAARAADRARADRAGYRPTLGVATPTTIVGAQRAALALQEQVLGAGQRADAAGRAAELAEGRRVQAAIARRSAERLSERRAAVAAAAAAHRVDKQLDDLAVARWARS